MSKIKKVLLSLTAKGAYNTARIEADSACFCFAYQPMMPQKVKKLRKKR